MKKGILFLSFVLLCGCQSTNIQKNVIYQIQPQEHRQCMGYIIHDSEDHTIVIDGGTGNESKELMDKIKEVDDDDTVDGWFITHYHDDHTGALVKYLTSDNLDVTIKNVYSQLASEESVKENEPDRLQNDIDIQNVIKTVPTKTVKSGQSIHIGKMTIDVMRDINYSITNNFGNNSSIVYKVNLDKKNILFLGDLGLEASEELVALQGKNIKNMDFVQMAHHGQNGGSQKLYQIINPKYCLWPTTEWIYENKEGKYKTDEVKSWMRNIKVKKNYFAYKKLYAIDLSEVD